MKLLYMYFINHDIAHFLFTCASKNSIVFIRLIFLNLYNQFCIRMHEPFHEIVSLYIYRKLKRVHAGCVKLYMTLRPHAWS